MSNLELLDPELISRPSQATAPEYIGILDSSLRRDIILEQHRGHTEKPFKQWYRSLQTPSLEVMLSRMIYENVVELTPAFIQVLESFLENAVACLNASGFAILLDGSDASMLSNLLPLSRPSSASHARLQSSKSMSANGSASAASHPHPHSSNNGRTPLVAAFFSRLEDEEEEREKARLAQSDPRSATAGSLLPSAGSAPSVYTSVPFSYASNTVMSLYPAILFGISPPKAAAISADIFRETVQRPVGSGLFQNTIFEWVALTGKPFIMGGIKLDANVRREVIELLNLANPGIVGIMAVPIASLDSTSRASSSLNMRRKSTRKMERSQQQQQEAERQRKQDEEDEASQSGPSRPRGPPQVHVEDEETVESDGEEFDEDEEEENMFGDGADESRTRMNQIKAMQKAPHTLRGVLVATSSSSSFNQDDIIVAQELCAFLCALFAKVRQLSFKRLDHDHIQHCTRTSSISDTFVSFALPGLMADDPHISEPRNLSLEQAQYVCALENAAQWAATSFTSCRGEVRRLRAENEVLVEELRRNSKSKELEEVKTKLQTSLRAREEEIKALKLQIAKMQTVIHGQDEVRSQFLNPSLDHQQHVSSPSHLASSSPQRPQTASSIRRKTSASGNPFPSLSPLPLSSLSLPPSIAKHSPAPAAALVAPPLVPDPDSTLLNAVFSKLPQCALVVDQSGTVLKANELAVKALGFAHENEVCHTYSLSNLVLQSRDAPFHAAADLKDGLSRDLILTTKLLRHFAARISVVSIDSPPSPASSEHFLILFNSTASSSAASGSPAAAALGHGHAARPSSASPSFSSPLQSFNPIHPPHPHHHNLSSSPSISSTLFHVPSPSNLSSLAIPPSFSPLSPAPAASPEPHRLQNRRLSSAPAARRSPSPSLSPMSSSYRSPQSHSNYQEIAGLPSGSLSILGIKR